MLDILLVDDEPMGQSPMRKRKLSAGEHRVSAYLPGFALEERTVRVEPGKVAKLALRLQKAKENPTRVSITSSPSGAKVFLGKVKIGKTPIEEIRFKPGRHVLLILHPAHAPYEMMLDVAEGQLTTHHADLAEGPAAGTGLLGEPEGGL